MQKIIRVGLLLLMGSLVGGVAAPKPTKAQTKPASAIAPLKPASTKPASTKPASTKPTVKKPSGADALTGTSGARLTKPADAAGLVQKWQTFKAPGVELSLPENYRGGSPNTTGLQTLIKGIRSLGADYEQIASLVERNPNTFLLIAVDPKPDVTGGVTNVVVSAVKVPETVTVDAYLDAAVKSLPAPIRTIERKTVQIGQNPAGRLVTEAGLPSSNAPADGLRQLIYVIKQGTTLWTVAYSTRSGDYQQRLAMFEQSIASFKVQADQPSDSSPTVPKPGSKPGASKKPTQPIDNQKPGTTKPASDRKPSNPKP